ncbi:ribosomal RNA-processing protein 7-domain-containing protein [Amanita rubescens]|nr:ribosomal RNA-processing protein 7-domain-containing protein [Amanita rubescens]
MPPDATEREVVQFFKFCGTVERVLFDFMGASELLQDNEDQGQDQQGEGADGKDGQRKRKRGRKTSSRKDEEVPKVVPLPSTQNIRRLRKTGKTAHVVFLDASSLDRFLSVSSSKPRAWTLSEEPIGLSHYIAQYAALRPPLDAVKEHADSYIRVYDYEQEKMKQKSKYRKGEAIVDEDGFTMVVRGGAYGRTLGGGVAVASKKFQQTGVANEKSARKRRKAGEDKGGFYAFQKAEKQRNALIELKRKWEEDKAKIEKLKESRRFKPY